MYQQGYQDGPNGNGQERGWYADPPYQDAPAPRRRSRSRGQNDRDTGAPSQQGGYAQRGMSHGADLPGYGGSPQGRYNEPAAQHGPYGYEESALYEPGGYREQGGYPQGGYDEPAGPYGYEEAAMSGYPAQNGYPEQNSYPLPNGRREQSGYRSRSSRMRGGYEEPASQYRYDGPQPPAGPFDPVGYDEPAPVQQRGRQVYQSGNGYGNGNGYEEPVSAPGQRGQQAYQNGNGYSDPAPVQQHGQQPYSNSNSYNNGNGYEEPVSAPGQRGQQAYQNGNGYNDPAPVQQHGRQPYSNSNSYNNGNGYEEPVSAPGQRGQQPYQNGNGYNDPAPVQQHGQQPYSNSNSYNNGNGYEEPVPAPGQRGQQPYQNGNGYGNGNGYDEPVPASAQHGQQAYPNSNSYNNGNGYDEPIPAPAQPGHQPYPNGYTPNEPGPGSYGAGYRPAGQGNGNYPSQVNPGQLNGGSGGPPALRNLLIALVTLAVVVGGIALIVNATKDSTQQGNNNPPVSTEGQPIITLNKNQASAYATKFLPNVYVDGICLAEMTFQEGSDAVWAQAQEKQSGWYVRLKNENGNYKDITADMLGISFDPTSALQQAWAIGHTPDENGQVNDKALMQAVNAALATEYHFTSAQQSANTSPIDTILDTLQTNAYRAPQDAVILSFNPDDFVNPFTFQQEVWGQWLDISAVKQEILNMVSTLESGEVMLTITPIAPNVTVADLQKTVTLRCRAVTPISSSSTEDRTNNIRVALSKINGKSLAHGDKFSFNKFVGRRTTENGFFQAIEYAYGEEVMGVGGGVCQASTTVYLAAVQSGMTITSREAHSNPVNYTSLGMDATVSDTRGREVDFTFKNESGGRIFIAAHVVESGSNRRSLLCEVRIYGPSLEDVHYKLESETVEVLPKPEEPKLKEDKTGEHVFFVDETKQASKGREGYVVDTYLCTYQGDTLISREKISTDTYPARQDVMWVGINPR